MDIYQLRTFVVVAHAGSVTRAAEILHLSQPAVSAHIKSMEDSLGLGLFQRTPRGMSLTGAGERLLAKAEQTLAAHQELLDEAARNHGQLTGKLRVGAGSNSSHEAVGRLLSVLSERHPAVEVHLQHGTSREILSGIRNGTLDAGFYNEPGEPDADLVAAEVSRFNVFLTAAPGLLPTSSRLDWGALAKLTWIYPGASACCGQTAENIFRAHGFRPRRIVSVDRQELSRTLIASGVGVGLLHSDSAREAEQRGEVEILHQADTVVRTCFSFLRSREQDPVLLAAASIVQPITAGR